MRTKCTVCLFHCELLTINCNEIHNDLQPLIEQKKSKLFASRPSKVRQIRKLNKSIANVPALKHLDREFPEFVNRNASKDATGAVIEQEILVAKNPFLSTLEFVMKSKADTRPVI